MDDWMQYRLSLMREDIEELLIQNQLRAHVCGGTSRRNVATFVASSCGPIAATTWDDLEDGLQQRFGAARVELTLEGDDLITCVELPSAATLLQLFWERAIPKAATAPLGLDADKQLISLDFGNRNARHVLFLGSSGAGKTAALRTCVYH